ncbi:MAG: SDR family oxidoreductase [Acidimicrobiia bacterium]
MTGGAHRVGRAIVLELADARCRVGLHYGTSVDAAKQTASELEERGVTMSLHQGDLSIAGVAEQVVAEASEAIGPLRVLVNSAAVFPEDRIETITREQWDTTVAINLNAPVFLTQAFAAQLPDGMTGSVVNISDWRIERPYPDHFSYNVTKGALSSFTRVAAAALAPRVRVNALALGAILPPPGKDFAYLRELAQDIPLRRPGSPEAVGKAVRALLENDFVTGQVLGVTGGAELV